MATEDVLSAAEAAEAIDAPSTSTSKLGKVNTAVSRRLDELVGPIVRRTITGEVHRETGGRPTVALRRWPVVSVSSAVEYDRSGSSTSLTVETFSSKPADGFRLEPTLAEPELGLFGPTITRTVDGNVSTFDSSLVVTYVAGRYANTAAVDERYKEACRICLVNLWQRITAGRGVLEADFDVPRYPFPTFAVPRSARELLEDVWQERSSTFGIG